jgi:hypothetical protein
VAGKIFEPRQFRHLYVNSTAGRPDVRIELARDGYCFYFRWIRNSDAKFEARCHSETGRGSTSVNGLIRAGTGQAVQSSTAFLNSEIARPFLLSQIETKVLKKGISQGEFRNDHSYWA